MNKHTLAVIVIIIIVIIGGFLLFTNKAEAPQEGLPINTSSETNIINIETEEDLFANSEDTFVLPNEQNVAATITYTDDGFSPDSVTILRGDTVRFVNESSDRMWVGSDIHPTHSLYPEKTSGDCLGSSFDQCRASVNGESWEFTFDKVGEWRYHNHVRASKRGFVIVK